MRVKEGDRVRITDRETTAADIKDGFFYPHFRGLIGIVDRIYGKEACVRIDVDSLPEDIRNRHLDIQESIKRKWLNGLSSEVRNRLTAEEKQFQLAYTILVQLSDLEVIGPAKQGPVGRPQSSTTTPSIKSTTPDEPMPKTSSQLKSGVTSADLDAAEAAFLRQREEALKKKKP